MTQHIVVVSTGLGCIVVPGHGIVSPGEEVKITNQTRQTINLSFPNPKLWGSNPPSELDNRETGTGTVATTATGGFYPYSVYCQGSGDYAEGNSHPAFIVS